MTPRYILGPHPGRLCGNPKLSHVRCKRVCLIRHIASPSRYKAFLLGWLLVFWLVPEQVFMVRMLPKSVVCPCT
jgi:hypothetical protein